MISSGDAPVHQGYFSRFVKRRQGKNLDTPSRTVNTAIMTHAELIDALGGVTVVAKTLGITAINVVGNWRQRGVPWRWRPVVAKLAARKHIALPDEFLTPQPSAKGKAA